MPDDKALADSTDLVSGREPLHPYDLGMTAASACQADQRFSYSLYVPKHFRTSSANDFRLLVVVHGTDRPVQKMLESFRLFADENNYILVAPLFPARIGDGDDMDNYKYILYRDIRFDLVLLHMVEEIGRRYGIDPSPFSLFGFSGGAHFAHRFLMLHPKHLTAVSIAAPGSVTLLDESSDWWVGIRNVEKLFGTKIQIAALQGIPVHLVVGTEDTNTLHITHTPGSQHWMENANIAGLNRVERLQTLATNLRDNGLIVEFELLPGVGHDLNALTVSANRFFRSAL